MSRSGFLSVLFLAAFTTAAQNPAMDGVIQQKQREASLQAHVINDRAGKNKKSEIQCIEANGTVEEKMRLQAVRNHYRMPTEAELAAIAPDAGTIQANSKFTSDRRFGLIRMMPDMGCDEITLMPGRSVKCELFSLPGGGAAFSFRIKNYRTWRLADLIFDGKNFLAFGQVSQGFIVRLGDTRIEELTLKSPGMKFLADVAPATDPQKMAEQNAAFVDGVSDGSVRYAKIVPAEVGTTYVIRSIAYQADVPREMEGLRFNEFDFDKRTDVIVAFRVLSKGDDGSLIILWRELRNSEAPVIATK